MAAIAALACASCGGDDGPPSPSPTASPTPSPTPTPTPTPRSVIGLNQSAALATFADPWALAILPDGRFLVTQRRSPGTLSIVTQTGTVTAVNGVPTSIGLLDVALAPDFATSRAIYFSYMVHDLSAERVGRAKDEPNLFPERMMVARATLTESNGNVSLTAMTEIFRQVPTIVTFEGSGEPGGRIAFSPDGRYLYLTSGDRQELDKDFLFSLSNNLGKVVRLFPDGTIPPDNPFVNQAGARGEIWTLGHRNHYGLAFAPDGRLWSSEMGPMGGDEFNLILPNRNYGWPAVSNGDFYTGNPIPDHAPGDGFEAPKVSWTPVIAPAGMLFYKGSEFSEWRGDALLTGLASKTLVRIRTNGDSAQEVQRFDMGTRIRAIAEAPNGSLWILTDGTAGELRRITPVF
ncbi:PQQ-dependent sugar dehydrogenase [Novosphingobium sp. JCM 18896]|uniref:PQQ-dependent sugar dehydrogenase n=1 Tax=Novosphingobium sp. JCM 18896 TaxID=2989731 RepID=UPI0022225232|nr:PQQ-dependent sugar dehydrogenase [Novosphingobium sp. JCM 18896]